MKILVCIKQVPDTLEVKLSGSFTLQRDFVAQQMNPADESALELGLRLRDLHGGSVTVLTMGPAKAEDGLRDALARGADEAVLLCNPAFAGADTLATAKALATAATHLGVFDLLLLGKRAIDGETGQVGPMLASLLDIPCIPNALTVEWEGQALAVSQLTETEILSWQCPLPAAVTLCEWRYPLRLPTLAGLKRAQRASIPCLSPQDIGLCEDETGLRGSPTRVKRAVAKATGTRTCQKLSITEVLEVLP